MNFKETLQRYHVSPLQYSDGKELEEKDYFVLGTILLKYYYVRKTLQEGTKVPKIPEAVLRKCDDYVKRSLIGADAESLMDMLMEQGGIVV